MEPASTKPPFGPHQEILLGLATRPDNALWVLADLRQQSTGCNGSIIGPGWHTSTEAQTAHGGADFAGLPFCAYNNRLGFALGQGRAATVGALLGRDGSALSRDLYARSASQTGTESRCAGSCRTLVGFGTRHT